ncbi:hypothetical protein DFJ43DRAFT_420985 [Lentinula guzmanii]|uniref:Uncharacterized protein n=1 Tax=Lentinula guzmanii TaxID=2804957 RepID=A0AA38JG96_9AGAR|nr:hypothetical protein DFJ43DRAFT_420985 [Lentinula guzmanii]
MHSTLLLTLHCCASSMMVNNNSAASSYLQKIEKAFDLPDCSFYRTKMYCVPLLQKLFIAYILVGCLGTVIASPLLVGRSPRTSSSEHRYVKTTGFIVSPQSRSQLGYTLTLEFKDMTVLAFTRKDSQTIVQAPLPKERYKEIINLKVGWLWPLAADLNTLPKDKTGSDWIIEAIDYLMQSGGNGDSLYRGTKNWMKQAITTQVEKVRGEVIQSQKAEVDRLAPAIQYVQETQGKSVHAGST